MSTPLKILQQYWKHDHFRPLQEDIIEAVLQKKDVLALLPTGGGKSVCFQVPAMLNEGICLVISPLIALIKDQVESLQRKGIGALSIYSGMHFMEVKRTLQNAAYGDYKFLYVSPERLETKLFLEFLPAIKPSMIVVDEAHCISQWGYDFRPAYLRIAALREELPGVNVIAVTASATPEVQEDICTQLQFTTDKKIFTQSFVRHNISYSIFSPEARQKKLLEILKNVSGSSLVYCKSRKATQEVASLLKLNGISADYYHAGMKSIDRGHVQESWLQNKIACISCTNAFGMGIDKPNVRVVVHYDVPESLENYYQEAGRAGRDGHRAYAVMLYEKADETALKNKITLKFPEEKYIKKVYTSLMNHLQVAAGAGENTSYPFDLALFATYFKLNILEASYAIKALGDEGLLSYNEVFFKPSTIVFTCSKDDLDIFYATNPMLEPVVKALLRSYEGIFDYDCTIYESLLAKFTRQPFDLIIDQLKELSAKKLIEYIPTSEQQQIYLLRNRMYKDAFTIDIKKLHARKDFYESRVNAMVNYLHEEEKCRNLLIANYFGDSTNLRCGVCDNCIRERKNNDSSNDYTFLAPLIIEVIGSKILNASLLLQELKAQDQKAVWQALNYLLGEGIVIKEKSDTLVLKQRQKVKGKKKGPR